MIIEGVKGAEATIVVAYDTTVYTVSYTPTTGENELKIINGLFMMKFKRLVTIHFKLEVKL